MDHSAGLMEILVGHAFGGGMPFSLCVRFSECCLTGRQLSRGSDGEHRLQPLFGSRPVSRHTRVGFTWLLRLDCDPFHSG